MIPYKIDELLKKKYGIKYNISIYLSFYNECYFPK